MFQRGSSQVSRRIPGNKAKLPAPGAYSILLFQPVWGYRERVVEREEGSPLIHSAIVLFADTLG